MNRKICDIKIKEISKNQPLSKYISCYSPLRFFKLTTENLNLVQRHKKVKTYGAVVWHIEHTTLLHKVTTRGQANLTFVLEKKYYLT